MNTHWLSTGAACALLSILISCKSSNDWNKADVHTADWRGSPPRGTISIAANFERMAKKFPSIAKDRADYEKWKASGGKKHQNFIRPNDLSLWIYYLANSSKVKLSKHCQKPEAPQPPTKRRFERLQYKPTPVMVGKRQWWRTTESKPGQPPRSKITYETCNSHKTWTVLADAVADASLADWYKRIETSLATAKLLE